MNTYSLILMKFRWKEEEASAADVDHKWLAVARLGTLACWNPGSGAAGVGWCRFRCGQTCSSSRREQRAGSHCVSCSASPPPGVGRYQLSLAQRGAGGGGDTELTRRVREGVSVSLASVHCPICRVSSLWEVGVRSV